MRNVEIIVDGNPLDVERLTTIPVKLTYLLQDLENFDKRAGYFSNLFTIPATKRANIAFGHYYDPKLLDAYEKFIFSKQCRVVSNGITVFNGTISGESVERTRGNPDKYSVQLVGQNLKWVNTLRTTPLTDAVPLSYTWDETTTRNSWTHVYSDEYVHPAVRYGTLENGGIGGSQVIEYWELRPWVFVRPIFEKFFSLAGYNLVSSFAQTDLFSRLIIYFNDDGSLPITNPGSSFSINYGTPGLIREERTCLDMLKGLIEMFNLYFHTNEDTKTVYCEPHNQFFTTTEEIVLTGTKSKITPTRNERFFDFIYNSSDVWNPLTGRRFDCRFDFEASNNNVKEFPNPFFSGTWMMWTNWGNGSDATPVLIDTAPSTVGGGWDMEKSGALEPRICVYGGMQDVIFGSWVFESDAPRTQNPYAFFQDPWKKYLNGIYNLNYSDLIFVDAFGANQIKGLVSTYYMNRLASLKRGGTLTGSAIIKPTKVANLDFRKYQTHDSLKWILLEIANYQPTEEKETTVKLLKNVLASQSDFDSLTHFSISSVLTFTSP